MAWLGDFLTEQEAIAARKAGALLGRCATRG